MNKPQTLPALGWSEWAALPALGLPVVLAKIDTGARSCSLHVDWLECFVEAGVEQVAFGLRCELNESVVECRAPVMERRQVTSSAGHRGQRIFIRTLLSLGDWQREVDMNLADRRRLSHPMLIGRSALVGAWQVDPARRFVLGERGVAQ